MKDRALYHLLIARVRKLTAGLDGRQVLFCSDLRETLNVDHTGKWFHLTWRWADKDYEVNVPSDMFSFYVRGDSGQGGSALGRSENWRQAEALLRHMSEICGADLPTDREPDDLAITFGMTQATGSPIAKGVAAAAAVAAVSFPMFGLLSALWAALAAFAICANFSFHRFTLLGKPMSWFEAGVIGLGTIVPLTLGTTPAGAALLAGGLALLALAEGMPRKTAPIIWALGGVTAGASAGAMDAAALAPIAGLAVSVGLLHVMMPSRLGFPATISVAISAASTALFLTFADVTVGATMGEATAAQSLSLWMIALLASVCFAAWWVLGRINSFFPWLTFAMVAMAAFALLMVGPPQPSTAGLTAFSGYLICAVMRLLRAFAASSIRPMRSPPAGTT